MISQFAPLARSQGLVASELDRNSAYLCRRAALASPSDASGHIDKLPVLPQHAGTGAKVTTKSVLPLHGVRAGSPRHSVGKEPVGEPSLSGAPECLSLQRDRLF